MEVQRAQMVRMPQRWDITKDVDSDYKRIEGRES